jgi:predicted lactoylglutathione lyase
MTKSDKVLVYNDKFSLKRFLIDYRTIIIVSLLGFVAGLLWFTTMRYYLINPKETHYHANFAVYVDGQRQEFKEFTYYEEIAACSAAYESNPKGRVHMHGNVNDVIHVHDLRVTYGNFFQNIGWTVGDDFIATDTKVLQAESDKKVTYILNGKEVDQIMNRVIGNEDRLLVSYGAESTDELVGRADTIAASAAEVNKYQDPASCGGLNGGGNDSVLNRLKRATFWQ